MMDEVVNRFVYRARRPFNPQRFFDRLSEDWNGVLLCKGFFWLANRLDKIGIWSQAERVARLDFGGFWWAAIPPANWPEADAIRQEVNTVIRVDFNANAAMISQLGGTICPAYVWFDRGKPVFTRSFPVSVEQLESEVQRYVSDHSRTTAMNPAT